MGKIWSPDCKFLSPTHFIFNSHENRILYITLHARKVKRGIAQMIINSIRKTYMYKATQLLLFSGDGFLQSKMEQSF